VKKLLKKERISIPQPRSTFLLAQCQKCENEQIIFSMTNSNILCKVCNAIIAEKTGGKAKIHGVVLRRLD
jgi:ribosomal protein S27E